MNAAQRFPGGQQQRGLHNNLRRCFGHSCHLCYLAHLPVAAAMLALILNLLVFAYACIVKSSSDSRYAHTVLLGMCQKTYAQDIAATAAACGFS